MNYKRIYDMIIDNAKNRVLEGYSERHHIIPKSLGGSNKKENLVRLTAREHFICHWLLTKFTKGKDRIKMLQAMNMMSVKHKKHNRYLNSKKFAQVKEELYGDNGLLKGKNHYCYGKKLSNEHRAKVSKSRKQMFKDNPEELKRVKQMSLNRTKEHQEKINEANRGQKRTKESRKLISEVHKGLQVGSKNGKSRAVSINGVVYESVRMAIAAGVNIPNLYNRINSGKYENLFYID